MTASVILILAPTVIESIIVIDDLKLKLKVLRQYRKFKGCAEELKTLSGLAAKKYRKDHSYKADDIICFCIAVPTVSGQPVSEIAVADILFHDFRIILNFFFVISLIRLFNIFTVENLWNCRRRNDRGFITP